MRWPEVDRDMSTVGSVADRSHPAVARIFIPLEDGDTNLSWSDVAAGAGVELHAETAWADLDDTPVARAHDLQSPYGMVDHGVIERLVALISTHTSSDSVYVVVKSFHQDDMPPQLGFERVPWTGGSTCWHGGDNKIALIRIEQLGLFNSEQDRRFPVAIFAEDMQFVVACADYSDSLIISGSDTLMQDLAATDLEWRATSRSAPLPVEF